jgi:hypothetical protein
MDPMLGTVGVAPAAGEVRSSLVPDAFGGNMDTPEMRAGVMDPESRGEGKIRGGRMFFQASGVRSKVPARSS